MNSIESALVMIDRASPAIRQIRRELRGLQQDADKAGASLDRLSGPAAIRQLDDLARQARVVRGELGQMRTQLGQTGNQADTTGRKMDTLAKKTKGAGLQFGFLGKALGMLKFPLILAGVGGLVQLVGGLTAGAVALLPKILALSGATTAYASTAVGIGAALGVWKLATHGLTQAMAGNKKALASLTPEGRAFLQTLRQMHPELQRLRATAQRGLFPGLTNLLDDLRTQSPAIRKIVGQTAGDLGNLASWGGRQIKAPGFMNDLVALSKQGGQSLTAAGHAGFYFAHAVEQILLAADPFLKWLDHSVVKLAKAADAQMTVGRQTGMLGKFFAKTKDSLITFADIAKHTFGGLTGVMHAATGEGNSLWASIDRGAKRFDAWSHSMTGQTAMTRYFTGADGTIRGAAKFVGALGKAIGALTTGPQSAQMLDALQRALPSVVSGLASLTANFGVAAVDALGNGLKLLGDLGSEAGPLTLVARAIGTVAHDIDVLVRALGPAGPALASFLAGAAIAKKIGLIGGGGGAGGSGGGGGGSSLLGTLFPFLLMRGRGGAGGGGGPGPAPGPGGGGGGGGGAGGAGGAGLGLGLLATLRGGARGARASYTLGRLYGLSRTAALGGTLGPAASVGLKAASKIALPVAALEGALAFMGTQGSIGTKLQGVASGLSLGLIPAPMSAAQVAQKAAGATAFAQQLPAGTIPQEQHSIATIQGRIRALQATPDAGPGGLLGAVFAHGRLPFGLGQIKGGQTKETAAQIADLQKELVTRQNALNQYEVRAGDQAASMWGQAFLGGSKRHGPEWAFGQVGKNVIGQMKELGPAGKQEFAKSMVQWATTIGKQQPKLKGQVHELEKTIVHYMHSIGQNVFLTNKGVLQDTTQTWKDVSSALQDPMKVAAAKLGGYFGQIQTEALDALKSMGFSSAQAKQIVAGTQQGGAAGSLASQAVSGTQAGGVSGTAQSGVALAGLSTGSTINKLTTPAKKKRARGGRLQGVGLHDTIPMADGGYGAPGELVVNRHSEAAVDSFLGLFGTKLSALVANETRPHSAPLMRARGGRVNAQAAGGAGGYTYPMGSGLTLGRTDQGVDFAGSGPIATIGDAMFTRVNPQGSGTGWPGAGGAGTGAMMVYELMSGADQGRYVYLAENVDPVGGLHAGSRMPGGTVYAHARGKYPFLETGWSDASGTPTSHAGYTEGKATAGGQAFAAFISGLAHGQLVGGGAGGAAQVMAALRAPRSGQGGIPGALANRANQVYAGALTAKVNAKLAAMGGSGGGGVGNISTVGGIMAIAQQAAAAEGVPWNAAIERVLLSKESGGGKNLPASGSLSATGPMQVIPGTFAANAVAGHHNINNPVDNMLAAFHYIKGRYRTLENLAAKTGLMGGGYKGYGLGGRLDGPTWGGWHARGGDFMVHKPTVFGAGENGPERVKITPGGGGGSVSVNITGGLHVGVGEARVRELFDHHMNQFAADLEREMATGSIHPESALMH